MPEKDPTTYSLLTYAWVFGLSAWGGAISYYRALKDKHQKTFSVVEFIAELLTASFFGVMTFYLCERADFDPLMTAGFVGIAGHMGSRCLYFLGIMVKRKGLNINISIPEEKDKKDESQ